MAITIKEPCSEDWSKMTVTQQGAFCQACALEVVDFTEKSPLEIKLIFAQKFSSSERMCGRIRNSQLAELNEDFIQWKNVQEEVRVIWIIALIAVFGFTLFSCSNIHSREVINQISVVSNQLLEADSLEVDSTSVALDTEKVKDSSRVDSITTSVSWPCEIITMGGIGLDVHPFNFVDIKFLTTICVSLGSIFVPEVDAKLFEKYLEQETTIATVQSPIISQPKSISNPPLSSTARLDASEDFQAEISPLPISEESRLRLEVIKTAEITITIKHSLSKTLVLEFTENYVPGPYTLSLELYKLPEGEYSIFLNSNNQEEKLVFLT